MAEEDYFGFRNADCGFNYKKSGARSQEKEVRGQSTLFRILDCEFRI